MTGLARKTLLREWPRFLPATLAIGFAGLLLIVQAALVFGIFGSAALYITASSADLWVGYPGTQSVNLGRAVNSDLEMALRMNPDVVAVEPLLWVDGDWRSDQGAGGVSVYVTGIRPDREGMLFDHLLSPRQKEWLQQPMAVIVDRSSLDQLAVTPGDTAWIDGHAVHVVAAVSGLRALGGVNVIASLETARVLATAFREGNQATYLVARLRDPARATAVKAALQGLHGFGPYEVWTADEFARKSQLFWMLDTGAGVAVLFLGGIVFLVGVVIASQALAAVVISSAREYATLNALGVGRQALRLVVLEQSAWIGGLGLGVAVLLSALLLVVAQQHDVPVGMSPSVALLCAALIFLLSLASGLFAMRGLMRADPSLLLR